MNEEQQKQLEAHNQATTEFIELANDLAKRDGQDMKIVSAALMAASGIYATFITAGNEGYLSSGGVDKIASVYKNNLSYIQERKKEELKAKGVEAKPVKGGSDGMVKTPHAEKVRAAEQAEHGSDNEQDSK